MRPNAWPEDAFPSPGGIVDQYRRADKTIDTVAAAGRSMPEAGGSFLLTHGEENMNTVKRGEIYYADLSPVVGSEQDGLRPVLVLQNDAGNRHSPTTIVAAITSKKGHRPLPTHVSIHGGGLNMESIVLLEQIRTIDKGRLGKYVGRLSKEMMAKVDYAIITSLGLKRWRRC